MPRQLRCRGLIFAHYRLFFNQEPVSYTHLQLLPQCRFWGGTPDAERAVAYWLPEYEDEDDYRENGPVACLRAAFFEENAVGHRDMLGALMGLSLIHI